MEPILAIENLNVQFDTDIQRINALNHVSLHVNRGEIVGIIGASGSGKSTLAKSILGLESKNQKTNGDIVLTSNESTIALDALKNDQWLDVRGKKVTMVFQNPLLNLNPSLSINKHFGNVLRDDNQKDEKVEMALKQVELQAETKSILEAYPHQLSGGQQQRILIALAILRDVDLLIMDEPMASLDLANQKAITSILRKLVNVGLAIVFISHDLNVVTSLSDRIYVLDQGEVIEEGKADEIVRNPKMVYTQSLIQAQKLGIRNLSAQEKSVILDIQNVSHTYDKGGFLSWNPLKVKALSDVNLTIHESSVVGLVGPSGSGKSTIVKILLGIEDLQEGTINYQGKSLSEYGQKELNKRMQLIPQNTADALNPKMILEDQLKDVYKAHGSQESDFRTIIESILTDVELDPTLLTRFPSELSGGEIQRMAIVRALIIRPDILVLDESLSALDMLIQKKTLELLHSLNEKLGMTMILISHDARLIGHSCDMVYRFENGGVALM